MKINKDYLAEICHDVYVEELDKDSGYMEIGGLNVKERVIKKYMEWRKCNRKQGDSYFAECTRFYEKTVINILEILEKRGQLKPAKKAKEASRNFEADFVYNLACDLHAARIGGAKVFIKNHMEKHKSTRERAEKRFQDFSQNLAPIVRSVLKVLACRDQLPKLAYREKK